MTFTVGEEVLYNGERFVVAGIDPSRPYPYRLLATTPKGARIVWAKADQFAKLANYTSFAPERPRRSTKAR
jgi:hypothetical protein